MSWDKVGRRNRFNKYEQICWTCKKCIGGCSWSRDFIPIEGWDAELDTHTRVDANDSITYKIYDCPQYEKGKA